MIRTNYDDLLTYLAFPTQDVFGLSHGEAAAVSLPLGRSGGRGGQRRPLSVPKGQGQGSSWCP